MHGYADIAQQHQPKPRLNVALAGDAESDPPPGLYQEQVWRRPWDSDQTRMPAADILASRWADLRTMPRREQIDPPSDRYIISIALKPARLRLARGPLALFEGTMPIGMVHVTEPGERLEAEFITPCDFVHFHVTSGYLLHHQAAVREQSSRCVRDLRDLMVKDFIAAQLGRTLTEQTNVGDRLYEESVGQTIMLRLLSREPAARHAGALCKWRWRRVQDYVTQNIAEPMTLADLAKIAGLSRMYFAAQFRALTKCTPHEYIVQRRIEYAQTLMSESDMPLIEVALSVGFQTQSHFSTVFKRLIGETPLRWRHTQRAR
ncbi:MAG: AraC family transcriptional regulator [Terracidiphilus sp.]|nr:AraC family transcriptional regulator [Terracidiphilus sp.]